MKEIIVKNKTSVCVYFLAVYIQPLGQGSKTVSVINYHHNQRS